MPTCVPQLCTGTSWSRRLPFRRSSPSLSSTIPRSPSPRKRLSERFCVVLDDRPSRAKAADVRPLSNSDERASFECGVTPLDKFFRDLAGQHQRNFFSTTYATPLDGRLAGLLTLTAGEIDAEILPERTRSPHVPLPILVLARMGADHRFRGRGLGDAMMVFTLKLARDMAAQMGCVGIALDAKPAGRRALSQVRLHGAVCGQRGFRDDSDVSLDEEGP